MNILYDFLALIYPRVCLACGNTLLRHEETLCSFCLVQLPRTGFEKETGNMAEQIFWGRCNVEAVAALYFFHKGSRVQHLLHQLKYKNQPEVGVFLGRLYGKMLVDSGRFAGLDWIIPVPLHPRRRRKRGYNQSEMFARGLAESMNIPLDTGTLVRITASQTQTRKSRFKRWENVKEIFAVRNPEARKGCHFLLVDDVLTTGATLEACCNRLESIPNARISIATLAVAGK